MSRAFNFCAGPATLPEAVLKQAQSEMLDWRGTGMSVMEMSHRSDEFVAIAETAEQDLRELAGISDDYAVLFMQGGASSQFATIPLNLLGDKTSADYINTGIWSKKAIAEAKRYADVSSEDSGFTTVPDPAGWNTRADAAYLHYTPNETIGGLEYYFIPDSGDVPLVADMSSTMLSRPVDVSKFGLIYAGAQKNIGPSGLVVVIIRKDLLGKARKETPTMMNYQVIADNGSMYNTPATYSWYLAGLVFKWLKEQGGVQAMGEINARKARKLYDFIDGNDFYANPIDPRFRSWMNVPFTLADDALNSEFLKGADARGLLNLKGHRSVGGMRASIYNAMPEEGVDALIDYMATFAKTDEATRLGELREEIDSLDQQIMALISKRAECAQEVAHVKMAANPGEDVFFYRPEREAQVLRRIKEQNPGPLPDEEMARLFREIMSACLALEKPMHIAFLGPVGTFTQAAALKHFGHSVVSVPLPAIDAVFREVESGAAHYGVVPVENSTEGMINHTLDMFMSSPLKICGEVQLRIHHHLLVNPAHEGQEITRIYSHQQSFAQCRKWLDANRYGVERITVSSNAEAARRAAEEPGTAAIAGDMAAELYGLEKLANSIEDRPDNTTRFLIIGREEVPASGHDKSSILVSMRNKPGALYQLLEPFHKHNISLTRIETRPSPSGTWAYVFYIDFEGHMEDDTVHRVLSEIDDEAVELKRLGSYPIGVL